MTKKLGNDKDYVSLEPDLLSKESEELQKGLLSKVVGQERAVKQLVRCYQTFRSGLQRPNRPLGVLLFLGPTGSGKTRLVEALSECLFGKREALLKIECTEFQEDHEIAKLIGSPPGYLGHKSTVPRITQEILDRHQRPSLKMSILLVDELEKASEAFHQIMLGIMDRGTLTLGDASKVDLTKTLIIMTSNEGSSELQKIASNSGMGFTSSMGSPDDIDLSIWSAAKESLKHTFAPEFLNRIDRTVVFRNLDSDALKKITDIELEGIQDRLLTSGHFILMRVTDTAKDFLRKEGTDLVYGARELNRTIERFIVDPMASLIASKQISARDLLTVDYKEGSDKLLFTKLEGVVDPPPPPQYESSGSQDLVDGRFGYPDGV